MSANPVNVAPEGTKLWLLDVGHLLADEGWMMRGGGTATLSTPNPPHKSREMVMISVLIEHPTEGLIIYETGAGKDYPEQWGAPVNDIFARVNYEKDHELDAAIAKTGHNIKDVKAIIIGHMHLDHAGGLENFAGTDVPVYIHELELKHAFYAVATKSDLGVYQPKDLRFDINWQPIHGDSWEFARGIDIIHAPGHTPGLCIMQVNLPESGTWIFTSDQYHVKENFEASVPQGWLARDHDDWVRSHQMIKSLVKRTNANLVLGHCLETFEKFKGAKEFYQ